MSITLPSVDLSSFAVGAKGTISLQSLAVPGNPAFTKNKPTLRMLNESGSGLQISFKRSVDQLYLGAGGWQDVQIDPGESEVDFQVIYIITTPVNLPKLLLVTYYAPGESIPPMATLGNSPVGVSGNVNVSTAQALQNDGNLQQVFIESTPSGAGSSTVSVDNEGNATIKGNNAGVLTPLLQLVAGASPLINLLGGIQIDSVGHLILPNNKALSAFNASAVRKGILLLDNANNVTLFAADANTIQFSNAAGLAAEIDTNSGLQLTGTTQSRNGTQSGTVTIKECIYGPYKITTLYFVNYEENTAGIAFALTNTFSGPFLVLNINGACVNMGSNSLCLATISATGGTVTQESGTHQPNTIGVNYGSTITQVNVAFPTLSTNVYNGIVVLIGQ